MLAALAASQRNSMSPKRIDALEESQEQRFFSRIACAAVGGMTGSVKVVKLLCQFSHAEMMVQLARGSLLTESKRYHS